ncbi:hypothetical protein ACFYRY_24530 [Streptomyces sp. NPDC005263]|uniref:hypothetical protein n=1 Tax=Streptomyces sp. NPDC005263 TaxID=3364711 RepID=UPI0036B77F96
MGMTITVLLFIAAFFCLVVGAMAATSSRMPPWMAGTVARPRLWGVGYALFGVTALYHAVDAVVHVEPAEAMTLTEVTTVTAVLGVGMGWLAQRPGRTWRTPGSPRSPRPEPGSTE